MMPPLLFLFRLFSHFSTWQVPALDLLRMISAFVNLWENSLLVLCTLTKQDNISSGQRTWDRMPRLIRSDEWICNHAPCVVGYNSNPPPQIPSNCRLPVTCLPLCTQSNFKTAESTACFICKSHLVGGGKEIFTSTEKWTTECFKMQPVFHI